MADAGRPYVDIDEAQLFEMAKIHCTVDEMSRLLNVSVAYLTDNYAQFIKTGRAMGKRSLRRKVYEMAEAGDINALKLLLKNYCGVSDTMNVNVNHSGEVTVSVETQAKIAQAKQTIDDMMKVVMEFKQTPSLPSSTMERLQRDAGVVG